MNKYIYYKNLSTKLVGGSSESLITKLSERIANFSEYLTVRELEIFLPDLHANEISCW